eukprot:CAMPEP_0195069014 /NCGR_PEP_ID=MMETSP0448-20130528/13470_1 /TAXON_ID=66468 /ORGANISM="Heterocapsa triquestra, Strain CCMP 448" /LENGTH=34 /DNA_ID= /DNA_START= /DNA_END= /DNA_ORIENTATION=
MSRNPGSSWDAAAAQGVPAENPRGDECPGLLLRG